MSLRKRENKYSGSERKWWDGFGPDAPVAKGELGMLNTDDVSEASSHSAKQTAFCSRA